MKKISFVVDFVVGDDEDFSIGVARSRIDTNVRDLTKHYAVVFKGEKPMDSHGMKVWSKRSRSGIGINGRVSMFRTRSFNSSSNPVRSALN